MTAKEFHEGAHQGDDSRPDAQSYRARIVREDDLLNSRTTLFLVTSGLLLTAVGLSQDRIIPVLISSLGIIVIVSWIVVSHQNKKVVATLTASYRKNHGDDYIEALVQGALSKSHALRPNGIVAIVLPRVFLVIWISIFIVYLLR